jgi:sporulation protein YtfJ
MANESKLQDVIRASLDNVRSMVDANTIIGDPITPPSGVTIIPISKISVGFATGGLDYGAKKSEKNDKGEGSDAGTSENFGGGGGTGLSIVPVGFLVVSKEGNVEMLNIGMKMPGDPVEQVANLLDRSPEIIAKIKALFPSKEKTEKAE